MRERYSLALLAVVLTILLVAPGLAAAGKAAPASIVLKNADIRTENPGQPTANALAIRGHKIVYIGNKRGASAYVGPSTRTYDLGGRMVIPGMIDSHTHPNDVALAAWHTTLPWSFDPDVQLAALKAYCESHPDQKVVYAEYYPTAMFSSNNLPTAAMIDAYVSDRAVIWEDFSDHACCVNSKALEWMGITAATPDPEPGVSYFQRDAQGNPTGYVAEWAWADYIPQLFQNAGWVPPMEMTPALLEGFINPLSAKGVVAVWDAYGEKDTIKAASALDKRGRLNAIYQTSVVYDSVAGLPQAIKTAKQRQHKYGSSHIRVDALKLFLDGTNEIGTSAVLEPFSSDPTGTNFGDLRMNEDDLVTSMLQLNKAGLDLHIHMVGDRAFRTACDAVERAQELLGPAWRTQVTFAHCELIDPADMPRVAELGIIINWSPHWTGGYFGSAAEEWLGTERFNRMYQFNPIIESGGIVDFGSDVFSMWEFNRANPFFGMQAAHTRIDPVPNLAWGMREPASAKLSLEDLLRGYTINGAIQLRRQSSMGSICVGKLADLAVLNANLFTVPDDQIKDVAPVAVLFEGKVVSGSLRLRMSHDAAIDKLVADGYPQALENYLTSQGTSRIGFAMGGTTADNNRASFLAQKLRGLGWSVRLEPVPLDVMTFKGASVTVGSKVMTASTFAGVPGTASSGITGEIVYVHRGTAADFDAAGDVDGKIVLIDESLGSFWFNLPWTEAAVRGAAGIVMCGWAPDYWWAADPDALGSFCSEYRNDLIPGVYISQKDGEWLKSQLATGLQAATVLSDNEYRYAAEGGVGYNVVATLKGKDSSRRVIVNAHHDAYFNAGLDDTAGCVSAVLMAKAMAMNKYRPAHDLVVFLSTGEEWGRVNTLQDWCIGSWHAITTRHPTWAGTTSAFFSLDGPGMPDILRMRATPEIATALEGLAKQYPNLLPQGYSMQGVNYSTDNWSFASAGVPGANFRERSDTFYLDWYHTQFDTKDLVDYQAMALFNKFLYRVVDKFDTGLVPYDMSTRAADITAAVNGDALKMAGADNTKVDRLLEALATFRAEATSYQARSTTIKAIVPANRKLLAIAKMIGSSWTATNASGANVYPHAQAFADLNGLNAALAALQAPANPSAAIAALARVGDTGVTLTFSRSVYDIILPMDQPWADPVNWGALNHLTPLPDGAPALDLISAGDYQGAIDYLTQIRVSEVSLLDERIDGMVATLDGVNAALQDVR